jgi:two-component system NtrC family sensor kinase
VSLYSVPPLITSFLALFLCFFVISRNPKSIVNITFGGVCLCTAYWQGTWALLFNVEDPTLAMFLVRIGYSGIVFIPVIFFHFIATLTNLGDPRLVRLFYILGGAFLFTLWFSDLFISGAYRFSWGYYPKAGPVHPLFLIALTIMLLRALALLNIYRSQVASQPIKVNQTRYVAISTVIYSFSASDFIVNYGFGFYPVGFVFTTAYTVIIAYAIIQYRLLDISLLIKKTLVYASLLATLLVPCYGLVVLAQQVRFGRIDYLFSLGILILFIAIGFFFPKFRFMTEDALERVLFKRRIDYRETLVRSSKEMVSIVELENLSNSLVKTVSRALGTETASLYLLDETKGVYNLKANIGQEKERYPQVLLSKTDPLVQRLTGSQEGIVKEELEMAQDELSGLQVAEKMSELEAEISVPISSKEKLIGILNLGHKQEKEIYSSEDLELLSTLANQAAIAIENARLYENLKQSQDTLRRADRLSSLGLLTAGLAHEIRNPLVAIRTFTQLLPERYDDAEFREGFQGIALKEVDRICGLINDLLSFARPSRPNVAEENMNDVVDGIARILETEAKEKGVEITRDFGPNLPRVWIDREQMKQVFMNLILNAIQAMREGGSIFLSTRLTSRNDARHPGQFVQVEVRDTGVGIPLENLDHIFDPFFTSKDEGSGLGLSISHQIVQEHGGYVTVESKVGVGTTFCINLPIGKPIRQLSNGRAHAKQTNLSH